MHIDVNVLLKMKNTRQNSIIFCGNPGTEKSHLCIAIASRVYEMVRDYTVEIIGIENNYRFKA